MDEKCVPSFLPNYSKNNNSDNNEKNCNSHNTANHLDSLDESEFSLDAIDSSSFINENNILLSKNGNNHSELISDDIHHEANKSLITNTSNNRNDNEQIIFLETPIIDENNVCLINDFDKSTQPKRLSDEFLSSTEEGDEHTLVLINEEILLSKKSTEKRLATNSNLLDATCDHENNESTKNKTNNLFSEIDNLPTISFHQKLDNKISLLDNLSGTSSSSTESTSFYENDVQAMDAIERRDFEHEKKLTGGIIIRARSLINSENELNLELVKTCQAAGERAVSSDSKFILAQREHRTTPTSSRTATGRSVSAAKINLSSSLDGRKLKFKDDINSKSNSKQIQQKSKHQPSSSVTSSSILPTSNSGINVKLERNECDVLCASNSNDSSLSSDKSANDGTAQTKNEADKKVTKNSNLADLKTNLHGPSTSKMAANPKFNFKVNKNLLEHIKDISKTSNINTVDEDVPAAAAKSVQGKSFSVFTKNKADDNQNDVEENPDLGTASKYEAHNTFSAENNNFDDESWADCEESFEEEVCTCPKNSTFIERGSEDDMLPSKDVDLSSYIQMVSISEDLFLQQQETASPDTSLVQRKRKLNESAGRYLESDSPYSEQLSAGRKRMAYDYLSTPRSSQSFASPSTAERRTPRSLIPTKDNPPPELQDWLLQFQRWSHAERLLAIDRLIETCEPTQVRHMMKVIEPQFQRDFISLLPRELALQVLSYLDPKDLLRAAQTCRSWRFLCDDNLLWKEKCKQAQILVESNSDKPKRGRAGNMPPISSPWKAAFMRQHIIEMNWRSRPIRNPKILKGHDDHVITCLQFYGNRIVSGSDDNTLKVWSAVSGKCLRTLVGHTGGVWSSQMSGNIIISGSTDRTLKVWDLETGQCIFTLLGHTSTVRCMHLHGKRVVSGSRDATLRVWDIEKGTCLHVLVGHLAAVRCVQYDGKLIVSGAYDYMVKIWHPERQECLHTLQGHTNRVYSLQFDGIHVVSGSLDTSIRVWDAETGNAKHTLMGHQSLTSGMELRQNILVSGNADSTVKVWDITTGQCLQTLSGPNKHQSAVTCLQFNSRFVITSSDDGTVKLWDVKTGEFIRNLVALDSGGSGGVVWRIRANDTKLICAVGSRNGTEETKLMVLDFDVEGACVKCS